jgi:hypothetical protein
MGNAPTLPQRENLAYNQRAPKNLALNHIVSFLPNVQQMLLRLSSLEYIYNTIIISNLLGRSTIKIANTQYQDHYQHQLK